MNDVVGVAPNARPVRRRPRLLLGQAAAPGRHLGRTCGAVLALVLGLLSFSGPVPGASAHIGLVSATPADSSTVASLTRVALSFSETLRQPSVVVVTGPDGDRVDVGPTTIAAATATVRVRLSERGRHTVAYRVVSADGHPVTGRTTFGFRPRAALPPASPTAGRSASAGSSAGPSSSSPTASTDGDSAAASPASASGPTDSAPGAGVAGWATGAVLLLAAGVLLLLRGRSGAPRPETGGRHR